MQQGGGAGGGGGAGAGAAGGRQLYVSNVSLRYTPL